MENIELIDLADELLVINKTTIERLFQENDTNVLVLYMFYYKTAKWQKHNPVKANDEYCRRCLHWGIDKLKLVKRRLKEIGLIEVEKRFNEKHQLQGWYIRINYFIKDISSGVVSTSRFSPLVDKQETNTINNNINTNNNKNTNNSSSKEINLIDYLQGNGFNLTPIQMEVVNTWEDTELTRYAIKQAVLNNKFNIKYIDKIIYSYQKNNITTIQQAIEEEENFKKQKDTKYKRKETFSERLDRLTKELEEKENEENGSK